VSPPLAQGGEGLQVSGEGGRGGGGGGGGLHPGNLHGLVDTRTPGALVCSGNMRYSLESFWANGSQGLWLSSKEVWLGMGRILAIVREGYCKSMVKGLRM